MALHRTLLLTLCTMSLAACFVPVVHHHRRLRTITDREVAPAASRHLRTSSLVRTSSHMLAKAKVL